MKKYPMTMDKKHYTVMANDLVKGKQYMTLQEARIVRLLVTQVVLEEKNFKAYTCRIADLAKFLGITNPTLYRDIRDICKLLMTRTIYIGTNNPKEPWKIIQWLQLAEYDGNGSITLMLSNQISPYILGLKQLYTQYQVGNILALDSYYSIRMYELLRCTDGEDRYNKNEFDFETEYLRAFFECENKFKQIGQFKEKVIERAIKEINEKSDIRVSVKYNKTGRVVTSATFHVMPTPELMGQLRLAEK